MIISIQQVPNKKLKQMLKMKDYQDQDSQKMIKDEIRFRQTGMTLDDLTNVFRKGTDKNVF